MSAIIERCVAYVKSIWEAIWDFLYLICYTKPTTRWRPTTGWRHRAQSPINVFNFWMILLKICLPTLVLPSICLVIWHTLSIRGCRSYPMRQVYRTIGTEALCWQPPPLDKDHSWWLTLWDQPTDHPTSLPEWIDGILIGYHLIFDAAAALQGQRLELEKISLGSSVANGPLDSKLSRWPFCHHTVFSEAKLILVRKQSQPRKCSQISATTRNFSLRLFALRKTRSTEHFESLSSFTSGC